MKIRVYGPCGSGKSHFSTRLAKEISIELFETDNMIWNRNLNKKYSREDRNRNLFQVLKNDSWIIEGAQFKWSHESFCNADIIVFIDPSPIKLFYRVSSRYIKMKFYRENYNYKQSFKELIEMYFQNYQYYRKTKHEFLKVMESIEPKLIIMKDSSCSSEVLRRILYYK